jgi:predicted outer membrane repeat protein
VLVVGNSAGLGAGGAIIEPGFVTMNRVRFINNQAGLSSGGVLNQGVLTLVNAVFAGNQANGSGGALLLTDGSAFLTNVLIHGNVAGGEGGGIGANDRLLTLTNTTIAGNRSSDDGGGLHADMANEVTITNSIIADNSSDAMGDQVFVADASTPTYAFSLVAGANLGGSNLPGATDPAFVSPVAASDAPTTSGNYRLQGGSPVLDQGNNDALEDSITTDLDGNPRFVDGNNDTTATVDLGPYERDVRAPSAITLSDATVVEDSADGSRVGTLTCTDSEPGDTTTLSLLDNAAGRFAISGNELQVGNGSLLDYEVATSHDITVRCTDSNNLSITETFTIAVENVPEPGDGDDDDNGDDGGNGGDDGNGNERSKLYLFLIQS